MSVPLVNPLLAYSEAAPAEPSGQPASIPEVTIDASQPYTFDDVTPDQEDKYPVFFRDGSYGRVSRDVAMAAASQGGRLATDEEADHKDKIAKLTKEWSESVGGNITSGAAGYFSNSFPGAKLALQKILEAEGYNESDASDYIEAFNQSNAGKIGNLAANVYSPKTVIAGKLGGKAGGLLTGAGMGELASTAGSNFAEGAAFSAMDAANEDKLENPALFVEHVVSSALMGGLLFSAIGVPAHYAFGALGKGIKAEAKAAEKAAVDPNAAARQGAPVPISHDLNRGPAIPDAPDTPFALGTEEEAAYLRRGMEPAYEGVVGSKERSINIPIGSAQGMAERTAPLTGQTAEQIAPLLHTQPSGIEARFLADQRESILGKAEMNGRKAAEDAIDASREILDESHSDARLRNMQKKAHEMPAQGVYAAHSAAKSIFQDVIDEVRGIAEPEGKKWAKELTRDLEYTLKRGEKFERTGDVGGMAWTVDEMRKKAGREMNRLVAASAGKGSVVGADVAKIVAERVNGLYDKLRNIQRTEEYFGPWAQKFDAINTPHHEQIVAGRRLFEEGYLKMSVDPKNSFYQKPIPTDKFFKLFRDPSASEVQTVMPWVLQYFRKGHEAAKRTVEHFDLRNLHPTQDVLNDSLLILGHNLRLSEGAAQLAHTLQRVQQSKGMLSGGILRSLAFGIGGLASHSPLGGAAAYGAATLGGHIGTGKGAIDLLRRMDHSYSDLDKNLSASARRMAQGKSPYVGTPPVINSANYNKIKQGATQAASDPGWAGRTVGKALQWAVAQYPKVVMDSQIKSQMAVEYLAKTMATNSPQGNPLQPKFSSNRPPSQSQIAKVNQVVKALADPVAELANPTPHGSKAVEAIYPELKAAHTEKVLEYTATAKEPQKFGTRRQVGKSTGLAADPYVDPRRTATIQQQWHAEQQTDAAADSPKGAKPIKNSAPTQMSMTQNLEAGGSYSRKR